MDECTNRAPGSLEWKDGEGQLDAWNNWVAQFDTTGDQYLDMGSDQYFFAGYESRQPEIDALKAELTYMRSESEHAALSDDNAALKAEVGLCHGTLESRERNIESILAESLRLKAENEKLRKVASEAIAALGSFIDGRDVCFDTVIENLLAAITAPDTEVQ